jgi:hypothetical protein
MGREEIAQGVVPFLKMKRLDAENEARAADRGKFRKAGSS